MYLGKNELADIMITDVSRSYDYNNWGGGGATLIVHTRMCVLKACKKDPCPIEKRTHTEGILYMCNVYQLSILINFSLKKAIPYGRNVGTLYNNFYQQITVSSLGSHNLSQATPLLLVNLRHKPSYKKP